MNIALKVDGNAQVNGACSVCVSGIRSLFGLGCLAALSYDAARLYPLVEAHLPQALVFPEGGEVRKAIASLNIPINQQTDVIVNVALAVSFLACRMLAPSCEKQKKV